MGTSVRENEELWREFVPLYYITSDDYVQFYT